MSCQGSPTATQYSTSLTTSYAERTIEITDIITLTIPVRQKRQDISVSRETITQETNIGGVDEISTNLRQTVLFDEIVLTSYIPISTLYAPCTPTTAPTGDTLTTNPGSTTGSSDGTNTNTQSNLALDNNASKGLGTITSDGMTIVLSEIVTTINGHPTTMATPIRTLLNTSTPLSDGARAGIIAGASIGGVAVLVALLACIFYFRRARKTRRRLLQESEKNFRSPRHLLEDEADDFDPMTHWDHSLQSSVPSAPRLLRPRGSRTGSLFHENVWPPPTEVIQDPLLTPDDLGSSISLVMGPPAAVTTKDAVGVGGGRQPITAYSPPFETEKDWTRHSRAGSGEPLLDSSGRGRGTPNVYNIMAGGLAFASAPSIVGSATSKRGERRSALSNSYTADDMYLGHDRLGSSYSTASFGRRVVNNASPTRELSSSADTEDSELLRDVLGAGSRTPTPYMHRSTG